MEYDPQGRPAYGAYGWATSGGEAWGYLMADYLDRHVSHAVHETATIDPAWIRARIDGRLMVVTMGHFTPAKYGHVALITGYTDDGRFIVNDPYGSDTDGSYDGKSVRYTLAFMDPHYLIAA
jgi:hypothetical protein